MEGTQDITERRIAEAWSDLQAHAASGRPLEADAYRLAFADPEFLLRRETRGIRFQLEMLKPDLDQQTAGVENTIVVHEKARDRAIKVYRDALGEAMPAAQGTIER